jgi:hypothetical protein
MKKLSILILSMGTLVFAACNNDQHTDGNDHDKDHNHTENTEHATVVEEKEIKETTVVFTNVDAKAESTFKQLVKEYLNIKNALVAGNSKDAAKAASAISGAMKNLDKSLLTAEQKKVYDDMEAELKEDAEHIAKNADNIKNQRSHFASMSKSMYSLVKNFGGGQTMYHAYCPMAQDDKGAMWMSEIKDIKNPYFGDEMLTCGTVEEMIK